MRNSLRDDDEPTESEQHDQNDGHNHPAPAPARPGRRWRRDDGRWRGQWRRHAGRREIIHSGRKLTQRSLWSKTVRRELQKFAFQIFNFRPKRDGYFWIAGLASNPFRKKTCVDDGNAFDFKIPFNIDI